MYVFNVFFFFLLCLITILGIVHSVESIVLIALTLSLSSSSSSSSSLFLSLSLFSSFSLASNLLFSKKVAYYLVMKAEGKKITNHPVVKHLVELRIYMEKMAPLENKLKYQIDKLLRVATNASDQAGSSEAGSATSTEIETGQKF